MKAVVCARRPMNTPAANMVEIVDLSPADALLPILECVSNSIISLSQSSLPIGKREITVEVVRQPPPDGSLFLDVTPIKDVRVTDNGIGFNDKNLKSFETPHSNILRGHGCLGVGRFTVLAAFQKMEIRSNFQVNGHWKYRKLEFDVANEVNMIVDRDSEERTNQTVVEIQGLFNQSLIDETAVPLETIAKEIMEHFLIFYLSDNLPQITVRESDESAPPQSVNKLYEAVAKDNEATFSIMGQEFKAYITRHPRITSRKHHYVHYCADSRVVGRGKPLGALDSIFNYPLLNEAAQSFLDVFVVSEYLNRRKTPVRNSNSVSQGSVLKYWSR